MQNIERLTILVAAITMNPTITDRFDPDIILQQARLLMKGIEEAPECKDGRRKRRRPIVPVGGKDVLVEAINREDAARLAAMTKVYG